MGSPWEMPAFNYHFIDQWGLSDKSLARERGKQSTDVEAGTEKWHLKKPEKGQYAKAIKGEVFKTISRQYAIY